MACVTYHCVANTQLLLQRKPRVTFLCIGYDRHVAANNMQPLSVVMQTQECVPIALLSTNKIFCSGVNSLNVLRLSCRLPDFLSNFNKIWIFSTYFHRSSQYIISRKSFQWETRSYVQAHSIQTERQTNDGQTWRS